MPIIQIFGTNKCQNTRAALRFFKERRIPVQFVDLAEKSLSEGEFQSVKKAVGLENMMDRDGKEYQKLNLKYQRLGMEAKLKENNLLLKTPVVRQSPKATLGYVPEVWKQWLTQS
jgi:arsenate reductase-like glutaredoxin family protein